jgi:hypothetical protein
VASPASDYDFPLDLKGLRPVRQMVWGQLDQDRSVRPDLDMVCAGLFSGADRARHIGLRDDGGTAWHYILPTEMH